MPDGSALGQQWALGTETQSETQNLKVAINKELKASLESGELLTHLTKVVAVFESIQKQIDIIEGLDESNAQAIMQARVQMAQTIASFNAELEKDKELREAIELPFQEILNNLDLAKSVQNRTADANVTLSQQHLQGAVSAMGTMATLSQWTMIAAEMWPAAKDFFEGVEFGGKNMMEWSEHYLSGLPGHLKIDAPEYDQVRLDTDLLQKFKEDAIKFDPSSHTYTLFEEFNVSNKSKLGVEIKRLLDNIGKTVVIPGHGDPQPASAGTSSNSVAPGDF